jgi:hypothetical protein
MNRMLILLTLACTAAGAAAADKQQVYKWTDASGVVHFTDTPPPKDTPNVQSVRIVGNVQSASEQTAPAADAKPPAAAGNAAAKPAGAAPDTADARAKECEQAKRNLALLQSNYSVSELGADGKVKPIDDKDRASRIAGVQDRITQFCGK